jgi:drug/metabolite transporter (DMT)-like permease
MKEIKTALSVVIGVFASAAGAGIAALLLFPMDEHGRLVSSALAGACAGIVGMAASGLFLCILYLYMNWPRHLRNGAS